MTPEQIKQLRERLGLTQARLAQQISETEVTVKRTTNQVEVARWETGKHPPGYVADAALRKIAEQCGIKL